MTKARFEREVGALREDELAGPQGRGLCEEGRARAGAKPRPRATPPPHQEALDEIQGYKSKRLAAKSEMIAIVRALETEREATAKRDAWVRETLLPKVLGHTVILQDTIATLDGVTQRLGGAGTAKGGGMTAVYRQEWARSSGDANGGGSDLNEDADRFVRELEKLGAGLHLLGEGTEMLADAAERRANPCSALTRYIKGVAGGGAPSAGSSRTVAPAKSGAKGGALELPKRAKTKRAKKARVTRVGDMDDDDDED